MKKPQYPCRKDCPGREMGCHGRCEAYQKFSEEQSKWRVWLNKNRMADLEVSYARMRRRGAAPYEAYCN